MTDTPVEEGAALLRKVHPTQVVPDNDGGYRVATGLFRGRPTTEGMKAFSVFVQARLLAAGAGFDAILGPGEAATSSVAVLEVGTVRALGLEAWYRPEGDDPVLAAAHAEVEGRISGATCSRLSAAATWAILKPPS